MLQILLSKVIGSKRLVLGTAPSIWYVDAKLKKFDGKIKLVASANAWLHDYTVIVNDEE